MLNIIKVSNKEDLNKCLEIRKEVFIEEKNVPIEIENDCYDIITETCDHFLIKYENISQKELKGTTVDFDEAFISKFILSTRVIEQYLTKNEANDNVKNAFLKVEQNVHSLIEHIYSILKSVYFVDFVVLKGIWKGNPYPIFYNAAAG